MSRLAPLFACLATALTLVGEASGALRIGVADDLGLAPDLNAWFFDSLGELGMSENRVSVPFDASTPTTIPHETALDAYVAVAALRGTRVVFSVSPSRARAVADEDRKSTRLNSSHA